MIAEDCECDRPLGRGTESDHTDDSVMRESTEDSKSPEVLIQSDQDAIVGIGTSEDLFVAGILLPIRSGNDVMSGRSQRFASEW